MTDHNSLSQQSFILTNLTKYGAIPQPKMIHTKGFLLQQTLKMFYA
jgi:hypothetical protein